jgi:hypothetical protein
MERGLDPSRWVTSAGTFTILDKPTETFWNFAEACALMGAHYPGAPLGLTLSPPCCHHIGTAVG